MKILRIWIVVGAVSKVAHSFVCITHLQVERTKQPLSSKQDSSIGDDSCAKGDDKLPSQRRRNMFHTSTAASILSSFLPGDNIDPAKAAESEDIYFGPTTPFSSRRQYKTIQLNNGLRVLLVSDDQAIRASAALSIDGAGQFDEPKQIPGLAHLMEHMALSSYPERDFEDWLEEREGASNAFTAPGYVCFHFNSPPGVFGEALSRFTSLFVQARVERICRNKAVITREIRRVDSELDYTSESTQAFYLLKDFSTYRRIVAC